ncbi:MAG: hypothetical protein GX567_12595 [Clostridia bacterium]|nr:hypothetical protein [Clostridia bacterium]
MQNLTKLLTLLLFFITISVIADQPRKQNELKNTRSCDVFFTRFNLYYEYGKHNTTNYLRGMFLPVNTPVTFIRHSGNSIYIRLPNDEKICFYNVPDYSGENLNGIFKRTLSTSKTNLSEFTQEEQKAIKTGEVRTGMSKQAVLVSIGYPPKHKTFSLESDSWLYWRHRFDTFIVEFENDTVVKVRN